MDNQGDDFKNYHREAGVGSVAPMAQLGRDFYGSCFEISWLPEGNIKVSTDSYSCNGKYGVYVNVDGIALLNKRDKASSIISTSAFWKDKDDTWNACSKTSIGKMQIGSKDAISWNESGSFYTVQANEMATFAISATITVEGEPSSDMLTRRRLPKLLPQPLYLKIVMIDQDKVENYQTIEILNPPRKFETKESTEINLKRPIDNFLYCDDTDNEYRVTAYQYRQKDKIFTKFSTGTYWELDKKDLDSIAFQACEEGKSVIEIPRMRSTSGTDVLIVFGLVDLIRRKLYGMKVSLQTKTSSVTDYWLLPKFPPMLKGLKPLEMRSSATAVSAQEEVIVTYNVTGHATGNEWIGLYPASSSSSSNTTDSKGYLCYSYCSGGPYGRVFFDIPNSLIPGENYIFKYVGGSGDKVICESPANEPLPLRTTAAA